MILNKSPFKSKYIEAFLSLQPSDTSPIQTTAVKTDDKIQGLKSQDLGRVHHLLFTVQIACHELKYKHL